MVLTPQFSPFGSTAAIAAFMIGGVLAPLILEQVGVLSKTMIVSAKGLVFETSAFGGHETPTLIVGMIYVAALIGGTVVTGALMRRQQRSAHHQLHMQTWQLRQLVPR
jgi:hypothetical protein